MIGIRAVASTLLFALVAVNANAVSISIDSPGGDTGASSFDWQGLTFVLDDQPGAAVNAPHRVAGDSNGEVSFFLEQPGKVSYRADISSVVSGVLPTRYSLGFRYGEDLSASTPSFSDMTGFYRNIFGGVEIVQQMLAGSDAANTDSVFYGTTGRTAAGGSMGNQSFLTNLGFGVDGEFEMVSQLDGLTETSVTASGVSGSADFTVDLTPGNELAGAFAFNELILQVKSFQDSSSFASQFGDTGQKFTFTSQSIAPVPVPGAGVAGLAMIGGLGMLRRYRRAA